MPTAPPVLLPTAAPAEGRPRAARIALVGVAVALAGVAAFGAVGALRRATPPSASPVGSAKSLFPSGAEQRIATLRDRLARGLLSLRRPEGDYSTQDDGLEIHPSDRADATWMGVAGLAAARAMGSKVDGLSEGIAGAKAVALTRKTTTTMGSSGARPKRGVAVSANACAVLALAVGDDPQDSLTLSTVARMLDTTSKMGTPSPGWVQGVVCRAMSELFARGHSRFLTPTPVEAIPSRPLTGRPAATDAFVAQALAEEVQREFGSSQSPLPPAVFEKLLADPPRFAGEQTSLDSWTLAAWLAARRPDGDRWFALALPQLEAMPGEDGVVSGEYYEYPVRRTAEVLLILWEGAGPRPTTTP